MRKFVKYLILAVALSFIFTNVSFAANKVVENPTLKTFVSGKQVKFDSVPITVNGEILLNANELLTKLGVPNDSKHIVVDKNKKNLTINSGKIKIKMTTNSNKATVDKLSKVLNSAPIIYKNKFYIPVKSTVQLLGMKFAWEDVKKSVYIQNVSEYNKIKTILDKAVATTKAVDKYIVKYTHDSKYNHEKDPSLFKSVSVSKVDKKKMLMNISGEYDFGLGKSNISKDEEYMVNNVLYTKDLLTQKWEKKILSKKDYDSWILQYDVSKFVVSDVLYCGLIVEESHKDDLIILKGNVYLFVKDEKTQDNSEPVETYTEITINKRTNLICNVTLKYNEYQDSSYEKYLYDSTVSYTYTDFNGDFNIELPEESKMDFEETENNTNTYTTPITLSADEEARIETLSSNIVKVPIDGAWKHPYNLKITQAIMFIVIKNSTDLNTFTNLSDDAKKVFINQIVQDNYGDYIGCETIFGIVTCDSKAYSAISTGYETEPQNIELEKYEERIDVTIVVQDKKNNTYQNYEGN